MTPVPRRRRAGAATTAAGLALLVLAGCGTGSVTATPAAPAGTTGQAGASPAGRTASASPAAPTPVPEAPTTAPAAGSGLEAPTDGPTPVRREPTPAVPRGHTCRTWVDWGERPDHGRDVELPDVHGEWTVVIRTDRSDDVAWATVQTEVRAGALADNPDRPLDIRFVDEGRYDGIAPQAVLSEDSDAFRGRYVTLLADRRTMREKEHTLVVVLLLTDGLERYRVTPAAAARLVRLWDRGVPGHTGRRGACALEAASDRDGVYRG